MSGLSRKRKRNKGALAYVTAAFIVVAVVALFGVSVFFRVSDIEISGAQKYSKEQILSASGLKTGDNMVFVNSDAVSAKITENLPYLSQVKVEKIVPDKILITVTESLPIAVISFNGQWWIIDQTARALEPVDADAISDKIQITGFAPESLILGHQLIAADSDQTKLNYLVSVLTAIESAGIEKDVTTLDFTNVGGITFMYLGRLTVNLGSADNADYKLSVLLKIVPQLQSDDKGRIDLSGDKYSFIPETSD